MIIVEGLDNTGKDTLIEQLRRSPEFSHDPTIHIHNGAPPKGDPAVVVHTMYELFLETYHLAADLPASVFINRGHVSGFVYDSIYRPTAHNAAAFRRVDTSLNPDRDVILYTTTDPQTLVERDDGLSTYTHESANEMIRRIRAEDTAFRIALAASCLPVIFVDTTHGVQHSLDQALNFLSASDRLVFS